MSTTSLTNQTRICPKCGAVISVYRDYVTWCEKCNWNLLTNKNTKRRNPLDKLYDGLGKKRAKYLFELLSKNKDLTSKMTPTLLLTRAFGNSQNIKN